MGLRVITLFSKAFSHPLKKASDTFIETADGRLNLPRFGTGLLVQVGEEGLGPCPVPNPYLATLYFAAA